MAWDTDAILTGDPDQLGEFHVRLVVDPDFPLPLAIVECAADLDIAISVKRMDSEFADLICYELSFVGSSLELSELDMRFSEWQARHHILNKNEQDLNRHRGGSRAIN
jgi:hypothetical protein